MFSQCLAGFSVTQTLWHWSPLECHQAPRPAGAFGALAAWERGAPGSTGSPYPLQISALTDPSFILPQHPTKHKERTRPCLPGTAYPLSTLPLHSPAAPRASPTSKAKQSSDNQTQSAHLCSLPRSQSTGYRNSAALPGHQILASHLQFHTTCREPCSQVPVLTAEPWAPGLVSLLEAITAISSSSGLPCLCTKDKPVVFSQRSYSFGALQHLLGCFGGALTSPLLSLSFPQSSYFYGTVQFREGTAG